VNGITQLRESFAVDNNIVVCQAAASPDGRTYIALVTPRDAWTKELIITTRTVFGYSLKTGDNFGRPMSGLNANMKMNIVDLGRSSGNINIQFKKAKTFGIMTNYGTMSLPGSVHGHLISFFWPNDSAGDHWNHFVNILKEGEHATRPVAGIASNVLQVGQAGAELNALFGVGRRSISQPPN